jgi:hypothetical protein
MADAYSGKRQAPAAAPLFDDSMMKDMWAGLSNYVMKSLEVKPTTVEPKTPQYEKTAKREVLRWGPYLLLPANVWALAGQG